MSVIIRLEDALIPGLEDEAKKEKLSVEQFANRVLAEAMIKIGVATPEQIVARIQSLESSSINVRLATADLGELLCCSEPDSEFDLEDWNRRWSNIES
jgi:hypothetical protein